MASEGPVKVSIHDLTGREMKNYSLTMAAGRQRLAWDGRDQTGRMLASGIYIVRLQTREGTLTRRIAKVG